MTQYPSLWAGTQESFDAFCRAAAHVEQLAASKGSKGPDDLPPLYEVFDQVAVLKVSGPLISGSAGWFRLFGLIGYEDIQAAAIEAMTQKGVRSMLMSVSSGGGAVDGCDECSQALKELGALKPIVTHASGMMASAAYWLGSSGQKRFASRTSIVGSIGVMAVHMERSKQFEKEGVGVTVMREGKWKALVNSYEPLSDVAKAKVQGQLAQTNALFEERVAANLGTSRDRVHSKMGQGREFMGAEAVEVGLIDAVSSAQEAFSVAKLLMRS
jgi:signal peptide peptidase SppA